MFSCTPRGAAVSLKAPAWASPSGYLLGFPLCCISKALQNLRQATSPGPVSFVQVGEKRSPHVVTSQKIIWGVALILSSQFRIWGEALLSGW